MANKKVFLKLYPLLNNKACLKAEMFLDVRFFRSLSAMWFIIFLLHSMSSVGYFVLYLCCTCVRYFLSCEASKPVFTLS